MQLSGLVLTSDSLVGIPYATVIIKNERRGTMTNYQGFFSLVTMVGDTVQITAIGFKTEKFVVPDTLTKPRYSFVQLLTDTIFDLPETLIFPWPTKEEFRKAFLSLNIPDDDLARAKRNLEREKLKELGEILPYDGAETSSAFLRQEAQKFYYSGQLPPQNIFNPIAWAQFIEAWKRGDFKRK